MKLRGSDNAAIYTIHGFCQRVLSDYAFEGCNSFDSEILPETRELLHEVVQDFWRREFYAAPRGWLAYALGRSADPEVLTRWVESYIGRPYIKLAGQARPHRIYGGSDLPVYYVGDPKQAIYTLTLHKYRLAEGSQAPCNASI